MHSPLNKRLPRELRNNLGKYLGIFLLMGIAIAMTSGFLVAASSIQRIAEEMPETYHVEDGRFATAFEADDATLAAVEELGCTVYPNFSCDLPLFVPTSDDELTVRLIKNRTDVNLAVYTEGEAPASSGRSVPTTACPSETR